MAVEFFDVNILANPQIFEQNRLEPFADFAAFADAKEYQEGYISSLKQSLNGKWRFHFATNLAGRPQNFYAKDYDYSHFDYINVPGHFETQGFGKNHYTNTTYPWEGHETVLPGQIPTKYNPVGSYLTFFEVPANFENTFICFDGVDSAFALFLNGHYVGYSEDSATPAHFDLTPFIEPGLNRLCVQVFKYSSGSHLEDQDYFRFSGIFRDVYIYTKPKTYLQDIFVTTDLHNNYQDATVNLELDIKGEAGKATITLYDDKDNCVYSNTISTTTKNLSFTLNNVKLWSAEKPNLYRLELNLVDNNDTQREFIVLDVGIREFKLIDGVMCINGKRIVFNGVNRHEFYPNSGRVLVDENQLVEDLCILKDLNVNAIRTSHYPNNSKFYAYCDKMGFYVINETNLETHGSWQALGKDMPESEYIVPHNKQEWQDAVLARGKAMLERDKNHACILINSCGNEAFGGSVIYNLSQYFRQRDPRRLVHYEGLFHDRSYNATSDMESQMYPSVASIKEFLAKDSSKPFICCEYTHAMGNSCGGMKLYTDLSHENKYYQGGFVWDFVDQALYKKSFDGKEYLAYGGDFTDRPNDLNFCCNGMLFADRQLSPKCDEIFKNYQNFKIEIEQDKLTITNYFLFTNLNEFNTVLKVLANGVEIDSYDLGRLDLMPEQCASFTLDNCISVYANKNEQEMSFIVEIIDDNDHCIAKEQKIFNSYNYDCDDYQANFELVDSYNYYGVRNENFHYMFSKAKGVLVSIVNCGQELLKTPMRYNFFRAPTDNDNGNAMAFRLGMWKIAGDYAKCVEHSSCIEDGKIKLSFVHLLGGTQHSYIKTTYTFNQNGVVDVSINYTKSDELPNEMVDFGVLFNLYGKYQHIVAYANGPTECYDDRDNGAYVVEFNSTTFDELTPYIIPQECGNHNKTRYVSIHDGHLNGISFTCADKYFNFSALPYSPANLESALHQEELYYTDNTYVKLSASMMGIGGDDSWGALPLEQYRIYNQDRCFNFRITIS